MPPQDTQLSPEEAKASLGTATYLQDQLLQHMGMQQAQMRQDTGGQAQPQPQNALQEAQEPQGEEKTEKPAQEVQEPKTPDIGAELSKFTLSITQKIDEMRKEMKDDNRREIDSIKKDIAAAIHEEDNQEKS